MNNGKEMDSGSKNGGTIGPGATEPEKPEPTNVEEIPAAKAPEEGLGSGESKLEAGISYLLITGVIISLILEVIGIAMFFHTRGNFAISQDQAMFVNGNDFFSFIVKQFQGDRISGYLRFMTIGIIVLVLTPFIRLVASVFYFGWEKNFKYVFITLYVAVVVTLSLALH